MESLYWFGMLRVDSVWQEHLSTMLLCRSLNGNMLPKLSVYSFKLLLILYFTSWQPISDFCPAILQFCCRYICLAQIVCCVAWRFWITVITRMLILVIVLTFQVSSFFWIVLNMLTSSVTWLYTTSHSAQAFSEFLPYLSQLYVSHLPAHIILSY
jgi:hypothetical protein